MTIGGPFTYGLETRLRMVRGDFPREIERVKSLISLIILIILIMLIIVRYFNHVNHVNWILRINKLILRRKSPKEKYHN
jgi:hypothetical protein